ncbi:acetolactate synthase 2 catalytic subunit [Alkalimarinus alittae]|uniref:Acetolactate synthase n=2 Tax=Alkalimarinus alittae TaxID=2961619 RepID=A0ABY6N1U7_9ALTE|nr:acetolactate synthase 2 catalytic subunit [Alkalimarinus alittae]UZE96087.1 acetolactate synthase 2 catalytic subunit [Alkalimarinus alittae]
MNGAESIIAAFKTHKIETIFGYPGGCIMPLYDALVSVSDNTPEQALQHILCRHEQGCALAADGYARASGEIGVCMATSGPGATNLITGVANAFADSIPMLVITGQVPTALIGTDAFQETDILGMTLGIVKHSYLVTDADELPSIVDQAIQLAQSGRPGPVWVDIPKDVLLAPVSREALMAIESNACETSPEKQTPRPDIAMPAQKETIGKTWQGNIEKARQLLASAKKPLLYSGGGVSMAMAENTLRTFLEETQIPCVETLKGLGNSGRSYSHNLGMLGMHGSKAANLAVQECDLLISAGARFDDRATGNVNTFAPNAHIIQIECDPAEISKLKACDIALQGNLAEILPALSMPLDITEWQKKCTIDKRTNGFCRPANSEQTTPHETINGPDFVAMLSRLSQDKSIISCDVGQHQMWVAQHYTFNHPRSHLSSGGLGTMGFGLPAAIGAQFAMPDHTVINVSGDGSFMMNVQELATIKRHQLPIKIIILDNQCLGMVRQQQELFYKQRYSEIDLSDNPDFLKMAEAFEIPSHSITQASQMRRAIETLFAYEGPMLLHVKINSQENVWPIVKPGSANSEMIDETSHTQQTKGSAA